MRRSASPPLPPRLLTAPRLPLFQFDPVFEHAPLFLQQQPTGPRSRRRHLRVLALARRSAASPVPQQARAGRAGAPSTSVGSGIKEMSSARRAAAARGARARLARGGRGGLRGRRGVERGREGQRRRGGARSGSPRETTSPELTSSRTPRRSRSRAWKADGCSPAAAAARPRETAPPRPRPRGETPAASTVVASRGRSDAASAACGRARGLSIVCR